MGEDVSARVSQINRSTHIFAPVLLVDMVFSRVVFSCGLEHFRDFLNDLSDLEVLVNPLSGEQKSSSEYR